MHVRIMHTFEIHKRVKPNVPALKNNVPTFRRPHDWTIKE